MPLTPEASKMLRYLLERPEGCDGWLRHDGFVVQYGWHLSHHRYYAEVGIAAVSWLRDTLGGDHGMIPAGKVAGIERFPSWEHGPRCVWIAQTPDEIRIQIREATSLSLPENPPGSIEPPIEYLAGTTPCPHCGKTPERYRVLRDGARVCLSCGASSAS